MRRQTGSTLIVPIAIYAALIYFGYQAIPKPQESLASDTSGTTGFEAPAVAPSVVCGSVSGGCVTDVQGSFFINDDGTVTR